MSVSNLRDPIKCTRLASRELPQNGHQNIIRIDITPTTTTECECKCCDSYRKFILEAVSNAYMAERITRTFVIGVTVRSVRVFHKPQVDLPVTVQHDSSTTTWRETGVKPDC